MFLTLNGFFWLYYETTIHNIAFSSEKDITSESGEKYVQIKHFYKQRESKTVVKAKVAKTKKGSVDFDVRGQ